MRQEKLKNWACIWIVGGITALLPILLMEGERLIGPTLTGAAESGVLAPATVLLFLLLSSATVAVAYARSQHRSVGAIRWRGQKETARWRGW